MSQFTHFQRLERMYAAAPINSFFQPTLQIEGGRAVVDMQMKPEFTHAAGAAHGAVYFKMLDDAAYFAANSLEEEFFLVTTSFTTYLTKPVVSGRIRSVGTVVNRTRSQFIVEAIVYDENGQEVARGSGVFVRSKQRLEMTMGYA